MKSLFEEMGGTYCQVGDYFIPNLVLPDDGNYQIGKYGRLLRRYLKEHRKILYTNYVMEGTLFKHLSEIDQACNERMETIVPAMAKQEGVTAKSSLLKQCIRIHTSVGTIECPKSHKLKCYDTKDNSFKVLDAGTIVADTKRYKLLKSKIDSQTRGLKVQLVGKRRDGTYYFSTELNEFIRFTANDVFTIVRDSYCMPCSGPDLQTNDVVLLSREPE